MRGLRTAAALAAIVALVGCSSATHRSAPPATTAPPAPPGPAATTAPASAAAFPAVTASPVRTVATTAGTVGYRSFGSGPPLVLIMGYGGSMDDWPPSFIDALAARYRVLTPDNPAVGRSSPVPAPVTVSAMAAQTSAFITALHLGRPDVLGWSMGGMLAQALAVAHPEQVNHLILCATLPGDGHAVLPSPAALSKLADPANPAAVLSLLFLSDPAGQAASGAYVSGIASWPGYYPAGTAADQAEGGALVEWTTGADPAGPKVATIKAPTLVADGDEDPLAPTGNPQRLAAAIPGAQLALYPDSAHAFMFQDQKQFVARALAFLAG